MIGKYNSIYTPKDGLLRIYDPFEASLEWKKKEFDGFQNFLMYTYMLSSCYYSNEIVKV
jgi:hypothetical protein